MKLPEVLRDLVDLQVNKNNMKRLIAKICLHAGIHLIIDKRSVYQNCINYYKDQNNLVYGLCHVLQIHTSTRLDTIEYMFLLFPELYLQKPKNPVPRTMLWFYGEDRLSRIKCLERAIELL